MDQQRRKFSERGEQQYGKRGYGHDVYVNQYASGIGLYECIGLYGDTGREYAYGNAEQQQRHANM
jgi:hypothetical protein